MKHSWETDLPYNFVDPDNIYRRRILMGCDVNASGCWEWTGSRLLKGYGKLWYVDKMWTTHRLTYHLFTGDIPKGFLVCHSCDNPSCCNPNHLFAGTHTDNHRDKVKKGRHANQLKTHCVNGHEYTEDSLSKHGLKRGFRACRTCINEQARKHYAARRQND